MGTDFDDIFTGSSAFIWSGFGVDKWGVTSIMNFWNMSLHCPQCGGLVYARSQRNCGFCGAELPPDFAFSEAEKAAIKAEEEERIKAANKIKKPKISIIAISCWLICAFGHVWLAMHEQRQMERWVNWGFAAAWMGLAVATVVIFQRQRKRFESQSGVG